MSITLALDASTYAGSVAVLRDGRVVAEDTVAMRGERDERLLPAVDAGLRAAAVQPADLTAIVCGAGPGSFTSLRIAAAIAKGFATVTGAPLIAVPSLLLMVAGAEPALEAGRYVAVLDAMRGDLFALPVELGVRIVPLGETILGARADVVALARSLDARLLGPGETLDRAPHARGAARLADLPSSVADPVELATWEPVYGRLAEAQVRWEQAHGRSLG